MQIKAKSDFSHYLQCKSTNKRFFAEFANANLINKDFLKFLQCKFIAKKILDRICNAKRQNKHFIKEFAKYILRFLLPFAFPSFDFLCEWEVLPFVLSCNWQKCAVDFDCKAKKQRFLLRLGFSRHDND